MASYLLWSDSVSSPLRLTTAVSPLSRERTAKRPVTGAPMLISLSKVFSYTFIYIPELPPYVTYQCL